MNILIINSILFTADNNVIPKVKSIKDTMIYNMCLGFVSLGHNIILCAAEEFRPLINEKYDFEIKFFRSDLKHIFLPSVFPYSSTLKEYLKNNFNNFNLIITSEAFSFQSLYASIFCPTKTVIWHELAQHQRKLYKIPSKFWYNLITRIFMRGVLIIPRSNEALQFISKYVSNVTKETVEHGINLDNFPYQGKKKKQFIVVSQLLKRKNIPSIILKFKKFLDKYKQEDVVLLIVGRGEEQEKITTYISSLNLENKVIIQGFKPHGELKNLLGSSYALLIDTLQDNNMVSIPESIVCGTPVLTNTIPTNSAFVNDTQTGIAKDWNEDDLYEISHNQLYIENCKKVRSKLSNIYQASKLINLYFSYQNT